MYKNGYLKVSAVSPKISVGDPIFNAHEIIKVLNKTKSSIILFPELTLSGYSAGDLFYQQDFIDKVKEALSLIIEKTTYNGVYIIGAPLDCLGVLYNTAIVVYQKKILGVIPKMYLPNHQEFYEKRWFHSGLETNVKEITLLGQKVPFGNLIFKDDDKDIRFGVEICQDLWAPYAPSDDLSLAGCNLIFNLSASPEQVSKPQLRRNAVLDHSRKQTSAYVYTSTGYFESTSEVVFSGHKLIASLGEMIKESNLFSNNGEILTADIDIDYINYKKRQDSTFRDMHLKNRYNYQFIDIKLNETADFDFEEPINQKPFIKGDLETKLANELQIRSLARRVLTLPENARRIVIGVSGGLDSTLALLVAYLALKSINIDPSNIIAVSMPSNVTSKKSLNLAKQLMTKLKVTSMEIPIKDTLSTHLKDIKHTDIFDTTYENAQARIRTMILMNLANKHQGFVLGTGDLSEIALGWMTYNGDQMSMYAINSGIPKTLVQELIKYHKNNDFIELKDILDEILNLPITPELLLNQETENEIGRYDINDFILHAHLVCGKNEEQIMFVLAKAFNELSRSDIKTYVKRFFARFYNQQFKRQTMPEGPKILSISLSPRGDYRVPSDVKRK